MGSNRDIELCIRAGPMKSLKMGINCVLRSRCTCCMTLNQDIFLHLFPGYYLMGLSREQGCDKIGKIGSKQPINTRQVGSNGFVFLVLIMDNGSTFVVRLAAA